MIEKLKSWWSAAYAAVDGWKMLILNLGIGIPLALDALSDIVGGLVGVDVTPFFPGTSGTKIAAGLAIANVFLRILTTGPIGWHRTKDEEGR